MGLPSATTPSASLSWLHTTITASLGYARYFQRAPEQGDDTFQAGTTFNAIRTIYEADEELRAMLVSPLARVELLLTLRTDLNQAKLWAC